MYYRIFEWRDTEFLLLMLSEGFAKRDFIYTALQKFGFQWFLNSQIAFVRFKKLLRWDDNKKDVHQLKFCQID